MAPVVDRQCRLRRSTSRADRGPDLSDIQAQIDAGATIDPLGDLGPLDDLSHDRTARPADR